MDFRTRLFKGHLEDGEIIHEIVHKHWFVIIYGMFKVIFFGIALPFFLYFFFPFLFWFSVLWMLIAFLNMIYMIFNWYLDAWLLTNAALIDVKWEGFFKRSAQRIEYASIEQVSYAYNGVFQTVFNYGQLTIQQPGGETSIDDIDHPKKVSSQINHYQDILLSNSKYQEEEALKEILTGIIKRYIDKHGININVEDK